jgi:DNA-binding Lrp family transcriptional regulator
MPELFFCHRAKQTNWHEFCRSRRGLLSKRLHVAEILPSYRPNGAFCWQSKSALHLIRQKFEAVNGVSSGLVVYLGLSEIASDRRSGKFEVTHAKLAERCGLSVRTVQQRIKNLSDVGLIRYTVPTLKSAATFELVVPDTQPLPSDVQSVPNVTQPLPSVRQPPETSAIADNLIISKEAVKNLSKTCSTKREGKLVKLSGNQKAIADDAECVLGAEWVNDAGKWMNRIRADAEKVSRVIGETKRAAIQGEIKTTPARYAEDYWKRLP